jgi:diketogulonate reductase-like aldo/keto reductase
MIGQSVARDFIMNTVLLPSGNLVPALGQGTWRMGENSAKRTQEITTLRHGIDSGMTLIDTAEMYGEGAAEELIGEAISGRREQVFLVSKVYPHNATLRGTTAACDRSLKRLRTDHLDCYLLHWRGSVPIAETLEAFQSLKEAGKIREYGVSNFGVDDMDEAAAATGGQDIATNQVLYNLAHRGVEWDLLPWNRERRIPIMAYSPIEHSLTGQKRMLGHQVLAQVAERHGATPVQIALAWLLRDPDVIVIPKASTPEHVAENRAALNYKLTNDDLADLDRAFPPPKKKQPLAMR